MSSMVLLLDQQQSISKSWQDGVPSCACICPDLLSPRCAPGPASALIRHLFSFGRPRKGSFCACQQAVGERNDGRTIDVNVTAELSNWAAARLLGHRLLPHLAEEASAPHNVRAGAHCGRSRMLD